MTKQRIIKNLLLVLAVLLFGCQNTDQKGVLKSTLQLELDNLIARTKVPGANLSVVMPAGDTISVSSGFSDLETNETITPDTKMPSGSIGKTYVAALAFQLIEQGKINLEDKVLTLVVDEPWLNQLPNIKDLTVGMLMNHTSGLPKYEYYDGVWEEAKKQPSKNWTVEDRLKFILNEKPLHPAGKGWDYSDSNYILLGLIIEKVTGEKYETILKRLTGNFTSTISNDSSKIKGLSSGYSGFLTNYGFSEKVYSNGVFIFNPQMEWCGGGLSSTTADLALWAKMLYEGRIISKENVSIMTTPVNLPTNLSDNARYGYGCIITICDSMLYYGHQGFFPGYRSIVQYNPKLKFSIALQINRDNPETEQTLNALLKPFKELVILHLNRTNQN